MEFFRGFLIIQRRQNVKINVFSAAMSQELGSFELHPGLYHVNAVELAASAMEMSALAGWNVANLAADYGTSSSRKRRRGSGAESDSKRPRVEL